MVGTLTSTRCVTAVIDVQPFTTATAHPAFVADGPGSVTVVDPLAHVAGTTMIARLESDTTAPVLTIVYGWLNRDPGGP
jgi:hypothetical protein